MIGVINDSIKDFVIKTFGQDTWDKVAAETGLPGPFVGDCPYQDENTYALFGAAVQHTGCNMWELQERYGYHFGTNYILSKGFERMLSTLGSNLVDFLQNLNMHHLHLSTTWKDMRPPSFNVEQVTPESCILHYSSTRPGLLPMAIGLIKGAAENLYKTRIDVEVLETREEGADHDVMLVRYPMQLDLLQQCTAAATCRLSIDPQTLFKLFPFHMVLDRECRLVQVGRALSRLYPGMQAGAQLGDFFKVHHPYVDATYDSFADSPDQMFILRSTVNGMELKGQMVAMQMPNTPPAASSYNLDLGLPLTDMLLQSGGCTADAAARRQQPVSPTQAPTMFVRSLHPTKATWQQQQQPQPRLLLDSDPTDTIRAAAITAGSNDCGMPTDTPGAPADAPSPGQAAGGSPMEPAAILPPPSLTLGPSVSACPFGSMVVHGSTVQTSGSKSSLSSLEPPAAALAGSACLAATAAAARCPGTAVSHAAALAGHQMAPVSSAPLLAAVCIGSDASPSVHCPSPTTPVVHQHQPAALGAPTPGLSSSPDLGHRAPSLQAAAMRRHSAVGATGPGGLHRMAGSTTSQVSPDDGLEEAAAADDSPPAAPPLRSGPSGTAAPRRRPSRISAFFKRSSSKVCDEEVIAATASATASAAGARPPAGSVRPASSSAAPRFDVGQTLPLQPGSSGGGARMSLAAGAGSAAPSAVSRTIQSATSSATGGSSSRLLLAAASGIAAAAASAHRSAPQARHDLSYSNGVQFAHVQTAEPWPHTQAHAGLIGRREGSASSCELLSSSPPSGSGASMPAPARSPSGTALRKLIACFRPQMPAGATGSGRRRGLPRSPPPGSSAPDETQGAAATDAATDMSHVVLQLPLSQGQVQQGPAEADTAVHLPDADPRVTMSREAQQGSGAQQQEPVPQPQGCQQAAQKSSPAQANSHLARFSSTDAESHSPDSAGPAAAAQDFPPPATTDAAPAQHPESAAVVHSSSASDPDGLDGGSRKLKPGLDPGPDPFPVAGPGPDPAPAPEPGPAPGPERVVGAAPGADVGPACGVLGAGAEQDLVNKFSEGADYKSFAAQESFRIASSAITQDSTGCAASMQSPFMSHHTQPATACAPAVPTSCPYGSSTTRAVPGRSAAAAAAPPAPPPRGTSAEFPAWSGLLRPPLPAKARSSLASSNINAGGGGRGGCGASFGGMARAAVAAALAPHHQQVVVGELRSTTTMPRMMMNTTTSTPSDGDRASHASGSFFAGARASIRPMRRMVGMQQVLLFLGSPRMASITELRAYGLYVSDLALHDSSREAVLMAEQRHAEAALRDKFERQSLLLEEERARSNALLYQMIPPHVADMLRRGQKAPAEQHDEVTILFSDIVGFTNISAASTPLEVCNMLDELYHEFDALIDDKYPWLYKVETIGDAYMLVGNVTSKRADHADLVLDFAADMHRVARRVRAANGSPLQIRVGVHTGPVVAGVVGKRMPRFCLFGDTVNTASRMESHGVPGGVHVSAETRAKIQDPSKYCIVERGEIAVKGKGLMETFLVSPAGATESTAALAAMSFSQLHLQLRPGRSASSAGYVAAAAAASGGVSDESFGGSQQQQQLLLQQLQWQLSPHPLDGLQPGSPDHIVGGSAAPGSGATVSELLEAAHMSAVAAAAAAAALLNASASVANPLLASGEGAGGTASGARPACSAAQLALDLGFSTDGAIAAADGSSGATATASGAAAGGYSLEWQASVGHTLEQLAASATTLEHLAASAATPEQLAGMGSNDANLSFAALLCGRSTAGTASCNAAGLPLAGTSARSLLPLVEEEFEGVHEEGVASGAGPRVSVGAAARAHVSGARSLRGMSAMPCFFEEPILAKGGAGALWKGRSEAGADAVLREGSSGGASGGVFLPPQQGQQQQPPPAVARALRLPVMRRQRQPSFYLTLPAQGAASTAELLQQLAAAAARQVDGGARSLAPAPGSQQEGEAALGHHGAPNDY